MGLTRPKYSQIYDSDWKNSCRVATTSNVTLVGGAPNTVDGVSLNLYDRVLVRSQTSGADNGIYYVSVVGTGSNGTWVRALDANDSTKLNAGATVDIEEGITLIGKSYRVTTPNPITFGNTVITWTDVSTSGGTGLTYTAAATPPASGNNKGDQWYNTTTDTLYEYTYDGTGNYWVDISSPTMYSGNIVSLIANIGPVIDGNTYVSANLIPSSNVTYSLGTPTQRFSSLYLSGNTIDLGGATIKTDATSGAIALIPQPTAAAPNPVAVVISSTGGITTANTTGGNITANLSTVAANAAPTVSPGKSIALSMIFGG